MQLHQEARSYVIQVLERLGATGVGRYAALLAATPADKVIEGLAPWIFLPTPDRSQAYCEEAAGRPVLPFAQAVGEDMMACFDAEAAKVPAVLVINPWAEDKAHVVLAELPHFEAWLAYAENVSRAIRAREKQEASDK